MQGIHKKPLAFAVAVRARCLSLLGTQMYLANRQEAPEVPPCKTVASLQQAAILSSGAIRDTIPYPGYSSTTEVPHEEITQKCSDRNAHQRPAGHDGESGAGGFRKSRRVGASLPVEAGILAQDESQRIPSEYDLVLLALGRSVYENLQRARQAALNREPTNLRVAIQEAGEALRRLQLPQEKRLLAEQLRIIRNDLKDRSKELDKELWVPVEAEIDAALVYVPEDEKVQARQAIDKARTAAAQGKRERVQANDWSLLIPNGLSLLANHSLQGRVTGLREFPVTNQPPALPLLFYTFRLMVAIGFWFLLLTAWTLWLWQRGKLTVSGMPHLRRLLLAWVASIPLGYIAVESGWLVREVGRQPWVVSGLLRTTDAASKLPATTVAMTLLVYAVLYSILVVTFVVFVRRIIRQGPASGSNPAFGTAQAGVG